MLVFNVIPKVESKSFKGMEEHPENKHFDWRWKNHVLFFFSWFDRSKQEGLVYQCWLDECFSMSIK